MADIPKTPPQDDISSTKDSSPSTPPSPQTEFATDVKSSRKREREVSLEPATPKAAIDIEQSHREPRDNRTPAKKNRIHLESTEEEEDVVPRSRSNSGSPTLSVSPPQEIKMRVRQISQGVEDLNWKNLKPPTPENDDILDADLPVEDIPRDAGPNDETGDADIKVDSAEAQNKNNNTSVQDGTVPSDDGDIIPQDQATSTTRRDSDSEPGENVNLKRKFLERGTSQGPQENGHTPEGKPTEPLKRLRDDADEDDNPRETKRPSPPPDKPIEKKASPATPAAKFGGFMSYASTSSPFGAVKGQNLFAPTKTPSESSLQPSLSSPSTNPFSIAAKPGESSSSSSLKASLSLPKSSAFDTYASPNSPFAAAARSKSPSAGLASASKLNRNKSPPRRANPANVNAFSSYVGTGVQSFAIPVPKRARAASPSGGSSRSSLERSSTVSVFGSTTSLESGGEEEREVKPLNFKERLRAGRDEDEDEDSKSDDESSAKLTEQDVMTGEEDEETIHQVRGKLFTLADGKSWKERGTGTLKINVRREDGSGARLIMRKEAVYTVILNVTLFAGMSCFLAQDPRYLRFSVIENGTTTHYNVRVASAKLAQDLLDEINANLPRS